MGYSRDPDFYTRGAGAIASADRNRARQAKMRRKAQRTAEYDRAMGRIAHMGGIGGMAPLGAFGRIDTDNTGAGGGTTTRPGVSYRPAYTSTTSFSPSGARMSSGGVITTGTGTKTPGVVTTNGQKPPRVTPDQNLVSSAYPNALQPGIMTAPTVEEDIVLPDSSTGMSTKTKMLIAGGAIAALYLWSKGKKK